MVYLIHFETKYFHAQHYIGFTSKNELESRMEAHRNGSGSRLLRAVNKAGISWKVVRAWDKGDGNFERMLKNCKNAKKLCPICKSKIHEKDIEKIFEKVVE